MGKTLLVRHAKIYLAALSIVLVAAVPAFAGEVVYTDSGGYSGSAPGSAAIAGGRFSYASGNYSSAYGYYSTASATSSSAYGYDSSAAGSYSSAFGLGSTASATRSSAYGMLSTASGPSSVAIGDSAWAKSTGGIAIGRSANAVSAGSVAIGDGAVASADNSVALGNGSVANQANTVSVGSAGSERRITNVAAGVAPTDAVNVSQLTALTGVSDARIDALDRRIDETRQYAAKGIASTLAIPPIATPSAPGKKSLAMEVGVFDGEQAVGFGFAYKITNYVAFNVGGSVPVDGGESAFRGGVAIEW